MEKNKQRNDEIFRLMELDADAGKVGALFGISRRATLNVYSRMKENKKKEKEILQNYGGWLLQFPAYLRNSLDYAGIHNEEELYRVVEKERYIPGVGAICIEKINRVISKRLMLKRGSGYTVLYVEG